MNPGVQSRRWRWPVTAVLVGVSLLAAACGGQQAPTPSANSPAAEAPPATAGQPPASQPAARQPATSDTGAPPAAFAYTQPVLGAESAPVTIVEFSDFQ